jgi:hypothetical protein
MRGADWLTARGIARSAVGVGVFDIQEQRMRTRSTSRTHPGGRGATVHGRIEHEFVPLERRLKTLQRNALETRAAAPPVSPVAPEFCARARAPEVACFLRFHDS